MNIYENRALSLEYQDISFKADSCNIGRARAPATCGELLQGFLDDIDFLVNSPIAYFADVKVTITDEATVKVLTPGLYTKVERAVRATLDLVAFLKKEQLLTFWQVSPEARVWLQAQQKLLQPSLLPLLLQKENIGMKNLLTLFWLLIDQQTQFTCQGLSM